MPEGLVTQWAQIPDSEERGLIFEYAARGIPVINLLYIKGLMAANGLPFDPVPLPVVGDGGVYYTTGYNVALAILGVATAFAVLAVGVLRKGN